MTSRVTWPCNETDPVPERHSTEPGPSQPASRLVRPFLSSLVDAPRNLNQKNHPLALSVHQEVVGEKFRTLLPPPPSSRSSVHPFSSTRAGQAVLVFFLWLLSLAIHPSVARSPLVGPVSLRRRFKRDHHHHHHHHHQLHGCLFFERDVSIQTLAFPFTRSFRCNSCRFLGPSVKKQVPSWPYNPSISVCPRSSPRDCPPSNQKLNFLPLSRVNNG